MAFLLPALSAVFRSPMIGHLVSAVAPTMTKAIGNLAGKFLGKEGGQAVEKIATHVAGKVGAKRMRPTGADEEELEPEVVKKAIGSTIKRLTRPRTQYETPRGQQWDQINDNADDAELATDRKPGFMEELGNDALDYLLPIVMGKK